MTNNKIKHDNDTITQSTIICNIDVQCIIQGVENYLKNDVDGELWLAAYAVDTPEFYPAHLGSELL